MATLRKIFKLRPLAQSIIKSVIGNGESTFLWPDNWHPLGPLHLVFGDRIRFNMGRNLHAKVTQEILQATPASFIPITMPDQRDDRVIWSASPSGEYSSKSAWLAIKRGASCGGLIQGCLD